MDLFQSIIADQKTPEELVQLTKNSIIGRNISFTTNLGFPRKLVYCDYFASGRPIALIEDIIRDKVLPFYANTHTTSTFTGKYMTKQRTLARSAIQQSVNADISQYAVLFTGTGSTSAILHFVNTLKLNQISYWPEINRPVVFISIMEHHSNILPWRESQAIVVTIPMNESRTSIDLHILERYLQIHQHAPIRIGAFSCGSNVTGVPVNVYEINDLLRRYKAYSCFDYAGIGPYVKIDCDRLQPTAIFLSPHKFVGGPSTPGVLVIDRRCLCENKPVRPGGGSVSWVSKTSIDYVECLEDREEAGTQDIIGSIRAGMVFQLKETITPDFIQAHEFRLSKTIFTCLDKLSNVVVLGPNISVDRIPVFCLVLFAPTNLSQRPLLLHHDFVSTLLNDLFGIQSRAGCMCAAIYGQYLLNNVQVPLQPTSNNQTNFSNPVLCRIIQSDANTLSSPLKQSLCPITCDETSPVPINDNNYILKRTDSGILCDLEPVKSRLKSPSSRKLDSDTELCPNVQSETQITKIHPRKDDSGKLSDPVSDKQTWPYTIFKPGYLRMCFNYLSDHHEIQYVMRALTWVASHGHLLLPYYQADAKSGVWSVRENIQVPVRDGATCYRDTGDTESVFADAEYLVQPHVLHDVCASIHVQADLELEQLHVLGTGQPLNQRRFAVSADVCRQVL